MNQECNHFFSAVSGGAMGTGTKFSKRAIRTARRWSAVALALLACFCIAGCAQHDSDSDKDPPGGFYGGLSGGMAK
jgi:hypothetical protein